MSKFYFVCKFDSFSKSVLSSNWPKIATLSLIVTPVGAKKIQIWSNLVLTLQNEKKWHH